MNSAGLKSILIDQLSKDVSASVTVAASGRVTTISAEGSNDHPESISESELLVFCRSVLGIARAERLQSSGAIDERITLGSCGDVYARGLIDTDGCKLAFSRSVAGLDSACPGIGILVAKPVAVPAVTVTPVTPIAPAARRPDTEYKVVPFTAAVVLGEAAPKKVAEELQKLINDHVLDGWDFCGVEKVSVTLGPGCFGFILGFSSTSMLIDQVVFKKSNLLTKPSSEE